MIKYIVTLFLLSMVCAFGQVSFKGNTFYFYGEFDEDSANKFQEFIETLPSTTDTIKIRIDSPGGVVTSLARIVNYLKDFKGTVETYNDGMAASCAFMLFMEGDKRYSNSYAMFLAHSIAGGARGKPAAIQDEVDMMNRMNEAFMKRLKYLGFEHPEKYFGKDDIYMTYYDMLDLHLLDSKEMVK